MKMSKIAQQLIVEPTVAPKNESASGGGEPLKLMKWTTELKNFS